MFLNLVGNIFAFREATFMFNGKKFENPWKVIEWKLYGPLLEIAWILIIHNNCIFPYNGYSIEIVWIYYEFSGAIVNFKVWISIFFPSAFLQ
jgi:hypothetical protein